MLKNKNHSQVEKSTQENRKAKPSVSEANTVVYFSSPELTEEELKQYAGMDVAIVDGKVIAAGHSSTEALSKARELFPNRPLEEILIDFIADEEVLIVCCNTSSLTKLTEQELAK